MNQRIRGLVLALLAAGMTMVTSCGSMGSASTTKSCGVYTTVAPGDDLLDLPAASYQQYHTFGYGMTPAAVVVGYGVDDGFNNRPQPFTLQVVETATGTVIATRGGEDFWGKASVIDLPVRKSGSYQVKLIINRSVYDTWDFTIAGDAPTDSTNNAAKPPAYAKGQFGISLAAAQEADVFTEYDGAMMTKLNNTAEKEFNEAKESIFAQLPPGKVLLQFDLDQDGQIHDPKILSNTLDDDVGQFFLRVLQDSAPYQPWPAAARSAMGSNLRTMQATLYLD
jgi:hypothetical protein